MLGATPLARERNAILAALLTLATVAWALLAWQAAQADPMMMGPTMGLAAPLFLALWVLMMVAMMFPTAAPMILTFHQVQTGKRARGQAFVSTWVFVGAYLAIWTLFGVLAYVAATAAESIIATAHVPADVVARVGGGLLIAAGLYQLSPLKHLCLSKCRTPLTFIMTSWRDGLAGTVRMGLEHGMYCLGCCWLLFVILFPLGVMNVAAMAVITVLIFAEKSLARGARFGQAAAVILVAYGVVALALPRALPTFTDPMTTAPGGMPPGMIMDSEGAPGRGAPAAPSAAPMPGMDMPGMSPASNPTPAGSMPGMDMPGMSPASNPTPAGSMPGMDMPGMSMPGM